MVDGSTDSVAEYARRAEDMQEKGVQYITMGIAGSDTDARKGPAFLVSGPQEAYAAVEPLLTKVAAAVDEHPCVARVGEGSAASYAKMICDSIEIGECQLLAEAYDVMRHARLSNQEMADTFAEWNKTEQKSYLLDITSTILLKKDSDVDGCKPSDAFLVDRIQDQAPAKRSGVDTLAESVAEHCDVSIVADAIYARYASIDKDARRKSECALQG